MAVLAAEAGTFAGVGYEAAGLRSTMPVAGPSVTDV